MTRPGPRELSSRLESRINEARALLGEPRLTLDGFDHEGMSGLPGLLHHRLDPLLEVGG